MKSLNRTAIRNNKQNSNPKQQLCWRVHPMKLFSMQCICYVAVILMSMLQVCKAETHEPIDILLFMFFGVGMGIVVMQCLNKIGDPVPFTVVVFISGILFSLATKDSTGTSCLFPFILVVHLTCLSVVFRSVRFVHTHVGKNRRRFIAVCIPAATDLW